MNSIPRMQKQHCLHPQLHDTTITPRPMTLHRHPWYPRICSPRDVPSIVGQELLQCPQRHEARQHTSRTLAGPGAAFRLGDSFSRRNINSCLGQTVSPCRPSHHLCRARAVPFLCRANSCHHRNMNSQAVPSELAANQMSGGARSRALYACTAGCLLLIS